MSMNSGKRYCIIGGGPMGIAAGKWFKKAGFSFDILEVHGDFGGTWNFDGVNGKVYESVHLISTKKMTEMTDFPMPETDAPYPRHDRYLNYLRSIAKHHRLYDQALFNHKVVSVKKIRDQWEVTTENGRRVVYDGLLVSISQFTRPMYPEFKGEFKGETLHARFYKYANIFDGKNVLIVGGGNSGCDIAVDAARRAKKTFHSTKSGYHFFPKFIFGQPTYEWMQDHVKDFKTTAEFWSFLETTFKNAGCDGADYGLPAPSDPIESVLPLYGQQLLYHIGHGDVLPKPNVKLLKEHSVVFDDGSEEDIDINIYATGYKSSFPFFEEDVMPWRNERYGGTEHLYLGMFSQVHHNLLFMGFVKSKGQSYGQFVNVQGRLAANYLKAYENKSEAYRIFRKTLTMDMPRLNVDDFVNSRITLWDILKGFHYFSDKLRQADAPAGEVA